MINTIIANYLAKGKRLVVPQFGAFIHKEGDGSIVFVPFLKKDDGVLYGLLHKEYNLDHEEAQSAVSEYIAQVNSSVAQRGHFTIEGVGGLRNDSNGILMLDYQPYVSTDNRVSSPTVAPGRASASVSGHPAVTSNRVDPLTEAPNPGARPATFASVPAPRPQTNTSTLQNPSQGTTISQGQGAPAAPLTQRPGSSSSATSTAQSSRPIPGAIPPPSGFSPTTGQGPSTPSGAAPYPGVASAPASSTFSHTAAPSATSQSRSMPPMGSHPGEMRSQGVAPAYPSRGGRPPQGRPTPARGGPVPLKRTAGRSDRFLIIAIIAAVVALAAIAYGVFSSQDSRMIDPSEVPASSHNIVDTQPLMDGEEGSSQNGDDWEKE